MDGHDQILEGVRFLQGPHTLTLPILMDPGICQFYDEAQAARAAADAAAARCAEISARLDAHRARLADEVTALKQQRAARAARPAGGTALAPNGGGLGDAARNWVLSNAW